jgi:hypothetical protein
MSGLAGGMRIEKMRDPVFRAATQSYSSFCVGRPTMSNKAAWNIDRWENLVLRAYLTVGAFVCGLTAVLVAFGKSPPAVDTSLLAALLYLAGCFNFVLAWRRWANGRGLLRAPQAFFATFIPYLAAGVVVGSPSGDTRVLLVLNIMLLAAFLMQTQKAPLKAS